MKSICIGSEEIHKINQNLQVIIGNVDLVMSDLNNGKKQERAMKILEAAESISQIINRHLCAGQSDVANKVVSG